ncbi:hypothetical protein Leryth_007866 [Lithospermum erythrorhizon]|nr:hypothetical protein Leryth_007866 [Lithospermum erythrorhizon]
MSGLTSLKSLDQWRSRTSAAMPSRTSSSNSVSIGSLANLKLTAEKLVKEQASAKTDLEMANNKLKKITEHVHVLEEKLQNAYNENAKLKVRQKEDEKLWKGLESKFSSTKTVCDQLTETLHHLAGQVQEAEKVKAFFEDKLSATSVALDDIHKQMSSLSLQLESSKETIRNRDDELKHLGVENSKLERSFKEEKIKAVSLVEEKDSVIKNLEATVAANGLAMESLNSKLEQLHLKLKLKEDDLLNLRTSKEMLEAEMINLSSKNNDLTNKLDMALQEIKNLEDFVKVLTTKLSELDNKSSAFSEKVVQLNALYESCFDLMQKEKGLAAEYTKTKFEKLQNENISVTVDKNALYLINRELSTKVSELQKEQQFAMVQHAEECRVAEEKIQKLESESEALLSQKTDMESQIIKLQGNIGILSENSISSENKMQDLLLKISELETANKDQAEKLGVDIEKKESDIIVQKKEIEKCKEQLVLLEQQIIQLSSALEEKDQLVIDLEDKKKQLEGQKTETQTSLLDAETKLTEAKKQYDQMLECKQLELSRHLKEISQRNDQAINDIRKRYELEKTESVNLEKEKAERALKEMERNCEQKLNENKEDSKNHLIRVQEEHASLICRVQQERDKKELDIITKHSEELRRMQIHAENELRERTTSLRNEHEAQLRALKCEHEDELRRLEEELDVQKSKEEKQRKLLQLQWKVMGNSQEDQEVTSKKARNSDSRKRSHLALERSELMEKDSTHLKVTQTPVSNMLKKAEKNTGPKHRRKEYEIETTNGRAITKKTKSTAMFGEAKKSGRRRTPIVTTPGNAAKESKMRIDIMFCC